MEISVGKYVRTKDGIIKRVISYNPQENNPLWETLNGNVQMKGTITKHSKDIIDLIEVGDYVNGCKVTKINIKCPITNNKGIECKQEDKSNGYEGICFTYDNYDIKTVLTKQQFESNAYTIEKER